MTAVTYDPALLASISTTLDLRVPNARALDALVRAMSDAEDGAELVADLATGVGKTYIAGGLLDYLNESGIRNVVIITPGTTIKRKTLDNLTPGHPKYLRGLQANPVVITIDDVEKGTAAQALDDPDALKVFVLTVQSLLRPDTKDNRRAHRPHEMLGVALSGYLRDCDDLVVIADEHHVYFSKTAKQFQAAIRDLDPQVLIGLTATPHESTPENHVVYRYPLAEAIADGYVKVPVLVARQDGQADERTQLADGVRLLDAKAGAMRAYCDAIKAPYIEPLLFIVAQTIDEANRLRDVLAGPDLLGGDDKVLLVTSDEPDETLLLLDTLEEPGSPIRAVVSVSMLKEGWDVKNIYVIGAVRAMESQLLTEQILGRGLRLPFGKRTGVGMLDTVEVLSHHAFAQLLDDADVLLAQTLGQRTAEATVQAVSEPGVATGDATIEGIAGLLFPADQPVGQLMVTVPGGVASDATAVGQAGLFDGDVTAVTHVVGGIATIDARVADGHATAASIAVPQVAREIGGVRVPLFIPRVTTRWVRDPFSLSSVDPVAIEALGRKFAGDHGATLTRKQLDATRTGDGVTVEIRDVSGDQPIEAYQPRLDFPDIEPRLVGQLLNANEVAATTTELNAAGALARSFLTGVGVTEETPWRKDHERLATEALVAYLRSRRTASQDRKVVEVTQVKWPDPRDQMLVAPPTSRHKVTSSKAFVRLHPYSGWERSIYETVAFHAFSTEFRLAELFDTTAGVKAWVRLDATVPLMIPYTLGAITHHYLPDFIVFDDAGVLWIVEGKAESELTNPVVVAKRDAAREWVNTVNAASEVQDRWGYLLAGEKVTAAAGTWAELRAASQTHGPA